MTQAKQLAAETGEPWLQNPDWSGGGAQPLSVYTAFKQRTFTRAELEAYGFELHLPPGQTENDLTAAGLLRLR